MQKLVKIYQKIKEIINIQNGMSLQKRLVTFFTMIIVFVILSFLICALLFNSEDKEENVLYNYLDNELDHVITDISQDFERISLQGVELSENISDNDEKFFKKNNIKSSDLDKNPELIDKILSGQIEYLLDTMKVNTCTGVFVILNCSVKQEGNLHSGIFLKKTFVNPTNTVGAKYHYLRGPAEIARDNEIGLLGQWKMEFDISDEDFFENVMDNAENNKNTKLTRLFYWSDRVTLKGNSEAGFLLCVPIRDSDNNVYGVCGLEVSDRLFKRMYCPKCNDYEEIFAIAAPYNNEKLYTDRGLLAGNYYLTGNNMKDSLSYSALNDKINKYTSNNNEYIGLQEEINLYPAESLNNSDKWAVAVMIKDSVIEKDTIGNNFLLTLAAVILLILSLFLSIYLSRRFLQPIMSGIEAIKSNKFNNFSEIIYPEIDDLVKHFENQEQKAEKLKKEKEKFEKEKLEKIKQERLSQKEEKKDTLKEAVGDVAPILEEFINNINTLSKAERKVFDLYVKGYTSSMVSEELCLSINTIKTHSRRIYTKLNVSTRKELMVYIEMMKKINIINND